MADQYEARKLPPVGAAPPMWGAWDHQHSDWVRTPGPDQHPERFTSELRVELWAAQQTDTTPTARRSTS
ncbi:hypothetical protein F4556_005223 [Kitasatospora gansuensis]|uniref:Uncharacterized protein n=1 Tax=Kitasatospora gansuensis TaxID=258050 RepID=A0A7W7SGT6_9ACTN|nr:hypothetical protein [Kitasatospora gansuensis]MBB4949688.1 hypothetical protein [Kitasatospora gansuensis]